MMRRATIRIAATQQLDLVCSLHDAFYINSELAEKDDHVPLLIDCMDQACKDILGRRVRIPVEINIYDSNSGYRDPKADKIEHMLEELLGNQLASAQS